MKKFWEGFKDILYDSTDYFIMVAIVGVVAFVIGWRLDLLFTNNVKDVKPVNSIVAEKEHISNEELEKEDDNKAEATIPKEEGSTTTVSSETIEIIIPNGSLPSSIGSILETKGLVSSKAAFVQKSQDMNLDTKLKSGNYKIKANTPMEDIVRLLTK